MLWALFSCGHVERCGTCAQGEDRAQLNLASMEASTKLKLNKSDMILYSAKVIPGNDKRVMKMFNRISNFGARVCANRSDGLHTRCLPAAITSGDAPAYHHMHSCFLSRGMPSADPDAVKPCAGNTASTWRNSGIRALTGFQN